jgi:hypothetical protein
MLKLNILGTSKRGEALCPTCAYAVTQRGFAGEQLTSCMLGGSLRELPFAVSECTAYADKHAQHPARVAGFIKPSRREREYAVIEIA